MHSCVMVRRDKTVISSAVAEGLRYALCFVTQSIVIWYKNVGKIPFKNVLQSGNDLQTQGHRNRCCWIGHLSLMLVTTSVVIYLSCTVSKML